MLVHGRASLRPAAEPRNGEYGLDWQEGSLALRVFPDDPALPQLGSLADAGRAVAVMPAPARDRLASRPDVGIVSFRPGERCTFEYGPGRHVRSETVYAKCYSGGHSTAIARRIAALSATEGERLCVPALLGHVAALGTVWQAGANGESPWTAFVALPGVGALRALAGALAELHASDAPAPVALRGQRVIEAVRKVRKLTLAQPALDRDARDALVACAALESSLPGEARELRHGDAHLGQFLLAGERVAAFDWDELAHGDLEQDLAALAVELEDAADVGCVAAEAAATLVGAYGAVEERPRTPDARLFAFHYRLQRIDRAYRDWWRLGGGSRERAARSIARASAGPTAALRAVFA